MRVVLDFDLLTWDDRIDFEAEVGCSIEDAVRRMADSHATVVEQRAIARTFVLAGIRRPSEIEWEIPGGDD